MLTALIGRIIIILFGVLHPSYRTYKAIRRKDYQEVVVLGMYWVVFSAFTTLELITDIFLQWLPFYHEIKIAFVIWLVTPATSGYSLIYRRLIHPELSKRENEIDEAIQRATEKGYTKVVEFGAKGLNYAAKTVLNTALLGQDFLTDQLRRRSTSLVDLRRGPSVDESGMHRPHRFGAGDHRDNTGALMFSSVPQLGAWERSQSGYLQSPLDDDPFALNWLTSGPTGSLGRKWKPQVYTGLSGVPEDGENFSEGASSNDASSTASTVPKRGGNVAQAYLRLVSPANAARSNSLPTVHTTPLGSPVTAHSRRPSFALRKAPAPSSHAASSLKTQY